MSTELVQRLSTVRDLKTILESTVKEMGENFRAQSCQIILSNPLDQNITAICEYKVSPEANHGVNGIRLPIHIQGKGFGLFSLTKNEPVSHDELNQVRNIIADLNDIIRRAQINDIVQRDTFRRTFLIEIGNVMNYSLGIGDALFMVVNILGKVLQSSRCLFICTDDSQAGWKCYEFWNQQEVNSCKDYCWPTTDSPLVAQTLMSPYPLCYTEGQVNSFVAPVQEELQFIGAQSVLALPLVSSAATHGCVILQQCNYRRSWTREEIDMVQSVADTVAEALSKLPQEKMAREPIMQLHQRTIAETESGNEKVDVKAVRTALKSALGIKSIPQAQKTSQPPAAQTQTAPPPVPSAQDSSTPPPPPPIHLAEDIQTASSPPLSSDSKPWSPLDSIDFGEEEHDASNEPPSSVQAEVPPSGEETSPSTWQQEGDSGWETQQQQQDWQQAEGEGKWGDLDSIGAKPVDDNVKSAWGDLDSIPSPTTGPAKSGLSSTMASKLRSPGGAHDSSLFASMHKDKAKFQAPVEHVEGPPIEIDEKAAQEKIQSMIGSSDPLSDYIFSLKNVDPRLLGRIDGWLHEIEPKDKYLEGHARQVAQYAMAIGQQLGLDEKSLEDLHLAALLHDVGKLGIPQEILQKPDEDLNDDELIIIMKHSIDGANLLSTQTELSHLAPFVHSHHEEFNGNGYPHGLNGEGIPLASRIINVANAYHNMVAPLCFRSPMDPTKAQEELTKGAGTVYDPRVVEALILAIMQQKIPAVVA